MAESLCCLPETTITLSVNWLHIHAKSLQLCPTLCDPVDHSLPGSSVHGILQARLLEWAAVPSSRDLPDPGIKPESLTSPASGGGSLPLESPGKSLLIGYVCCTMSNTKLKGFFFFKEPYFLFPVPLHLLFTWSSRVFFFSPTTRYGAWKFHI